MNREQMLRYLNTIDAETDGIDNNMRILMREQNRCFVENLIRVFNSEDADEPSCTDITTESQLNDVHTLFIQTVRQTENRLMTVASQLDLESLMIKYIDIEKVADDLHRWSIRFFNLVKTTTERSMVSREVFSRYHINQSLMTLAAFADFYEYLSEQSVMYNQGEDVVATNNECYVMDIITYQRNN